MYNTEKRKKNKLQISVTFRWNKGKCFLLVVYVGLALYASYIKWYGANLHKTVHDILEYNKQNYAGESQLAPEACLMDFPSREPANVCICSFSGYLNLEKSLITIFYNVSLFTIGYTTLACTCHTKVHITNGFSFLFQIDNFNIHFEGAVLCIWHEPKV